MGFSLSYSLFLSLESKQACKEKVRALESKISALTERLKHLLQRGTPDLDPLVDI